MADNDKTEAHVASRAAVKTNRSSGKPWIVVLVVLLAAIAAYAWWAKPSFLFARGAAQTGSEGQGTATRTSPAGAPRGGGGGGAGRPGGFGGGPGGGAPLAPVGVAKARTTDVSIYISALGSATAANTVTVRSRVDGQLMKLNFVEGQTVKAGQLLAEVDPRGFQVQLAQAQSQLARDEAQLQNAKTDLERYRTLLAQDSIAKQQLDTQESLVRQYEATLKMDHANIDSAKLQLTYARVAAPATGRIGLKQVDVGNVVRSSDANGIAVITQVQPINAVFAIPEANLSSVLKRLQSGQKITVEAWDREQKNKIATGALVTTDNQIDPTTGTIKLKAEFQNEDLALFPNQFINVRMLLDVRHDATVAPSAAIQRGSSGPFLYIVKDDSTVTIRPVRPGATQGEDTMFEDGVRPGETVVIDGTDRLREGIKVEAIMRADAPAAPADGQVKRRGRPGGGKGGDRPASGSPAAAPGAKAAP